MYNGSSKSVILRQLTQVIEKGKELRRRFRMPLQVFFLIVYKVKETGEKIFNAGFMTGRVV